jgi:hypothetical protein
MISLQKTMLAGILLAGSLCLTYGQQNICLNLQASASSALSTNPAYYANDYDSYTAWVASGTTVPQWWKVDLGANKKFKHITITWEKAVNYKFRIKTSTDNATWTTIIDQTSTTRTDQQQDFILASVVNARYVQVDITGLPAGVSAGIADFAIYNTLPTLSVTSPANNAVFTAPASITASATASDVDGTIQYVDFSGDWGFYQTDNTSPYSVTMTNAPMGIHTIWVTAYDDRGDVAYGTVTVNVIANCAISQNATASSSASGMTPDKGIDGSTTTRWCAASNNTGEWYMVNLLSLVPILKTEVMWQKSGVVYKYKIQTSNDQINWTTIADLSNNTSTAQTQTQTYSPPQSARMVRVYVTGLPSGTPASLYEFRVFSTAGVSVLQTIAVFGKIITNPNSNPDGSGFYPTGQVVNVTAVPDDGYDFVGWSGNITGPANPATITMNGVKLITANFAPEVFDKHAYYRITNKVGTTGVIDNNNASTNSAKIYKKAFDPALPGSQQWRILCSGTQGVYMFASAGNNSMVLDNGGSTADGATMTQYTKVNPPNVNQQWTINDLGTGYYQIICKKSNMALDNRDATYLKQKTISSTENNEQWKIEKIRWQQDKFIIAGFWGPVFSGNTDINNTTLVNQDMAALQIAKDGGFNLMITQMQCNSNYNVYTGDAGSAYTFAIAQKVGGIRLLYQNNTQTFGYYTQGVDEFAFPSANYCLKLDSKTRSAQYGYNVVDEPNVDGYIDRDGNPGKNTISNAKNWVKDLKTNDPGKLAYFNLGGGSPWDDWLNLAVNDPDLFKRPDLISYDYYSPLLDGTLWPMYFYLMNSMRTTMDGRAWFNYALAVQHEKPEANLYYILPSEATLRFDVFTSVAYGAKGIAYFTYEQPPLSPGDGWYYGPSMVAYGQKNPEYYWVQRINRFLADFAGPAVMASNTPKVYHSYNTLYPEQLPADQILPSPLLGQQPSTTTQVVQWLGGSTVYRNEAPFMAGVFQDKTTPTTYYVLVVNKDMNNSYTDRVVTLNHDCRNNIQIAPSVVTYDGSQTWSAPSTVQYPNFLGMAGTDIHLDFSQGEGILIKVTNVTNPYYTGN